MSVVPTLCMLACLAAGTAAASCSNPAGVEAQMVYNGDYHTWQFCNGSAWVSMSAGGGGKNTTMYSGWPDAITCNVTNPNWGHITFVANAMPYNGDGLYYYRYTGSAYDVRFNSNGTFNSYDNMTTTNCNVSISALLANGQAFYFVNGP